AAHRSAPCWRSTSSRPAPHSTSRSEMPMQRRRILQLGAFSALAGTGFGSLVGSAAAADYRAAVCVFLNGGCDANHLIVPNDNAGYAAYSSARPALAIPRAQLLPIAPASGGAYGLHPQMSELQ